MNSPIYIPPFDTSMVFPSVALASKDPNGLLAVGGDLSPERLISAYRQGIFPWFSEDQPILWWSPDPRMILSPSKITFSRSLKKTLRQKKFRFSFDIAFSRVIHACAQPRPSQPNTWITTEMKQAYAQLHQRGVAHSFETWQDDQLVGGLYGIAIGKVFFGESMFSLVTDASKVAFAHSVACLQGWGYGLIDCQIESHHLANFGAENISRQEFSHQLKDLTTQSVLPSAWQHIECDITRIL